MTDSNPKTQSVYPEHDNETKDEENRAPQTEHKDLGRDDLKIDDLDATNDKPDRG